MNEPDREAANRAIREAANRAIREAAEAEAAERARRQRHRDDVTARAQAAGWSTGPATWVYAGVVTVGVLAYLCGLMVGGPDSALLLLGLLAPVVFIVLDVRRGPLPKAHEDGRWTGPVLCGAVGAAAGLAAGAIVDGIQAQYHGCEQQSLGDCGFGMFLFALIIGPIVAVVGTAAVLALLHVRHAFFVAVLGVITFVMVVGVLASALPDPARHAMPLAALAGAVAYALAGAAHARNLSPLRRCIALTVILTLPLLMLVTAAIW